MLTPSLCLLSAAIYQCRFRIFLRPTSPAAYPPPLRSKHFQYSMVSRPPAAPRQTSRPPAAPRQTTPHFACTYCSYSSASAERVRNHLMLTHYKLKPYHCEHCGFKTHLVSELDSHVKICHANASVCTYSCDQCNYTSLVKTHLVWHKRRHTNVECYSCVYCPYNTNKLAHLHRHIRSRCAPVLDTSEGSEALAAVSPQTSSQIPETGVDHNPVQMAAPADAASAVPNATQKAATTRAAAAVSARAAVAEACVASAKAVAAIAALVEIADEKKKRQLKKDSPMPTPAPPGTAKACRPKKRRLTSSTPAPMMMQPPPPRAPPAASSAARSISEAHSGSSLPQRVDPPFYSRPVGVYYIGDQRMLHFPPTFAPPEYM